MPYRSVEKGDRISEYTLVEKIGQGGFGVVWKAEHAQISGKFVAIKIPTSPEGMDYLRQEAVFQHELDHPNIVKTIGLDTKHDPPYFIMEYVEGRNLRELMAEDGILPPPYAIDIAVQACEALEFAHGKGIVHKDVKPENILVEKKRLDISNRGKALLHYVKITDLGLGMFPSRSGSEIMISENASRTSGVRALSGTLFYMAPEQMAPGRQVDARADVYSLGVVLYEMLTGELPLGMDLPSELNPVVTPELDAICKRALSIDRDKRYQSTRELAADLQRAKDAFLLKLVAQGTPALDAVPKGEVRRLTPLNVPLGPSAPRATVPPRGRAGRRRVEWVLAGVALLLLAASAWGFLRIRRSAQERRELDRKVVETSACRLGGPLTVDARPGEAQISIDGESLGTGPVALPHPTWRRHVLRLSKEYYAPRELILEPVGTEDHRRFRVVDGATGRELGVQDCERGLTLSGVELTRLKGKVEITTLGVENAEVRVDGKLHGVTPLSRELDAGEHLFEISKSGYEDKSFYEKIEGGAKIGREITLIETGRTPAAEKPATHRLHLVSNPPDAVVYVNGEEKGRTPCDLDLPAGRHQLKLVKKHFETHAVELAVEAPGSREYELARVRARVTFDSDPRGATVYVDGQKAGITPATAEGVEAGSHKATFVLEGHYDQTASFEVVSRDPVDRPVKASLQRIPPGRLSVECEIRGTEIFVDGRSAGRAPLSKAVETGRRRIRVLGSERIVTVDPGADVKLSLGLRDLEMARIPEGEFRFGSSDARPGEIYSRTERTAAYYADVYEVTNEQYLLFTQHIRETGDHSRCHPEERREPALTHEPVLLKDPRYNGPRQPVVGVTWLDAYAYAAWAGKRLPTEMEWEKAARGKTGWTYPWGNDWAVPERRCNASGKDDGYEFTSPVGVCGGASPFGCFDMVGNVREWCVDDYTTKTGAKTLIQGKVLRGGSFLAREYNTTTMRESEPALHTSATVGFRCVLDDKR
jgi:formylglycine-generating enzyme required for sulfatase activity